MNSEHIHILLNKYWNCETSAEEEQVLCDFFSGTNIPEELERYAPLFTYSNHARDISTSNNFDTKLEEALRNSKKEKQYVTIRVFMPALRIAASLLLVLGLGLSVLLITKQFNKPYFAETYHDPDAAIKDATYALMKISQALNTSEEASLQTIQVIDNLAIDWSSLDSLNNSESVEETIEEMSITEDEIQIEGEL